FRVDDDGRAVDPEITQAPGPALPSFFGFTFDRHENLLVTELFGSATTLPKGGAGALSSFRVSHDGDLTAISSDVNDGGTAACWIALEPITGRFAFVANNLSASISSYSVSNAGTVTVGAFQINLVDGSLTPLTGGMGLPAGRSAQGLAAY